MHFTDAVAAPAQAPVKDNNQVRRCDRERNQREWRHWYWTARWRKKAKAQLAIEPLCAICRRHGRITAATVADHVEPHRGDPVKFWEGKLQSLCDQAPWRCHSSVKQREENGSGPIGNDLDGRPIDPKHPWNR